jgi:hypothetical protein
VKNGTKKLIKKFKIKIGLKVGMEKVERETEMREKT